MVTSLDSFISILINARYILLLNDYTLYGGLYEPATRVDPLWKLVRDGSDRA
jgi:hypothetical protein